MILGNLKHPSHYSGLGERVVKALQFMNDHDPATLPLGKNFIDGETIYFEVSEIESARPDQKLFEAHKKYLDIHITLEGEEFFGQAMLNTMTREAKPYNPEKDSAYYEGEGFYLQAPKGHFVLFLPEDAHKPGVFFNKQGRIKKIVMKIKI